MHSLLEHSSLEHALLEHCLLEHFLLVHCLLEHCLLEHCLLEHCLLEHSLPGNSLLCFLQFSIHDDAHESAFHGILCIFYEFPMHFLCTFKKCIRNS